MKVKYTGESFTTDVWHRNQRDKKEYKVIKNRIFNTGEWDRIESVLTAKGEWICDTDCEFFKENFQAMTE